MKKMKAMTFEFPVKGPMSIDNIERYACYSNKSIDEWMSEAIAWFIDFHESQRNLEADINPPVPRKLSLLTRLKLHIAERLQIIADRCLG